MPAARLARGRAACARAAPAGHVRAERALARRCLTAGRQHWQGTALNSWLPALSPPAARYPHYKDELTKLKFIGSITAQRLRDVQAHIANVPFTVVETGGWAAAPASVQIRLSLNGAGRTRGKPCAGGIPEEVSYWLARPVLVFGLPAHCVCLAVEQLKHLMLYADQNRQVEAKVGLEAADGGHGGPGAGAMWLSLAGRLMVFLQAANS